MSSQDRSLLAELSQAEMNGDLNEEGVAKLQELRRAQLPDTSAVERFFIGAGRGAMDTYQGIKQRALQAGEMMGLADEGAADTYTAEVNRERELYNELANAYPTSAGIGRFVGNAASVPVPGVGGTFVPRLLGNMAIGGGIGATQFSGTGSASDALQGAMWGAGGAGAAEGLFTGARGLLGLAGGRPGHLPVPMEGGAPMLPGVGSTAGRNISATILPEHAPPGPPHDYAFVDPEFGIPYTRGQESGKIRQQQYEQRVLHGAFGDSAQGELAETLDFQAGAIDDAYLRSAADMVQGSRQGQLAVPGQRGREYKAAPEAAGTLQQTLSERADKLWGDIGQMFDRARAAQAELPAHEAHRIVDRVVNSLDVYELQTPEINPTTHLVIDRLRSFIPEQIAGRPVVGMDANAMHSMRMLITNELGEKTIKNADAHNLRVLRSELDKELLQAADSGLLIGDPDGVRALREGIKLRADYGKLYGPNMKTTRSGTHLNDPVGNLIEKIIETDMAPEDIVREVFGTSRLGSKRTASGVLSRVERAAGRESEEYQALRNIALERLRESVAKPGDMGPSISPQKLRTEWARLRRNDPRLLSQLFSTEERDLIDRFVQAAGKTIYDPRAINPSKTAHMIEAIFKGTPATVGAVVGGAGAGPWGAAGGAVVGHVAANLGKDIKNALGKVFARKIYQGTPRSVYTPWPGAGAAAGQEARRELQE